MEKEIRTALSKSVKIAGVTCLALGGAALIASGAALKALAEGAKFARSSILDIINEQPAGEEAGTVEEGGAEEAAAPEAPDAEQTGAASDAQETAE